MLLGKRPRLPIKRTTSMTGIRGDLVDVESEESSDQSNDHDSPNTMIKYSGLVSPRNQPARDLVHPPPDHFLRTCRLCQRRLAPGRDIYMYRGDTAFCSSECREKQIKEDEGKEEYRGKKKDERHAAAGGRGSRKSQTAAPPNQ